ncbi:MAG: LysE family transporter [Candidatus Methanomethylicaceae archaeon]
MVLTWIEFLTTVVIISASGVMSPGPLTFATIATGSKRGWSSGLSVGFGHMLVELPLVFFIGAGAAFIASLDLRWVSLAGGLFMIIFGILTVRGAKTSGIEGRIIKLPDHPITLGIGLSSLNPYFLIWWATVGTPLVIIAADLAGITGITIMYASHVWMDFAWLSVLAGLGSQGKKLGRLYPYFVILLGLALISFGVLFMVRAYYWIF